MDQLKKALQKAGFTSSDQLTVKERKRKEHVPLDQERQGHSIRNQCEACERFSPNVEFYQHRLGILGDKRWLCMKCADENRILDDLRSTSQSPYARSGRFLREYGHTKKI